MPSGAITNVVRSLPMYSRPYMYFLTHTPYASATEWSSSPSSGKPEVVLVVELGDLLGRVGRDAEHDRVGRLVVGPVVAHAAGLGGAAGGVGLGIEVENDGLAAQARQRDGVAVLVGEGEVGGGVAGIQCHARTLLKCPPGIGRHELRRAPGFSPSPGYRISRSWSHALEERRRGRPEAREPDGRRRLGEVRRDRHLARRSERT